MKIAVSSKGRDLDAQVDPRFGRCRCFIVVDLASKSVDVMDNAAAQKSGGAGIQASQMIANEGVDAVITGSLGPNATNVLQAAGLKVYLGVSGTVREALQQYEDRQLQATSGSPADEPSGAGSGGTPPESGQGMGRGRGGGRGLGRGRGGGGRAGAGPVGHCICSSCGASVPHQAGVPCFEQECPKCGAAMRGYA